MNNGNSRFALISATSFFYGRLYRIALVKMVISVRGDIVSFGAFSNQKQSISFFSFKNRSPYCFASIFDHKIIIRSRLRYYLATSDFPLFSVIRMHKLNQAFWRDFNIIALHQVSSHCSWCHLNSIQQPLYLSVHWMLMLLDSKIISCQYLEAAETTTRHLNVYIHPTRSQQCWIKPVSMICREDYYLFVSTTRPQFIRKIQQS